MENDEIIHSSLAHTYMEMATEKGTSVVESVEWSRLPLSPPWSPESSSSVMDATIKVGFIGAGMLTAVVCGNLFASPSTSAIQAAIRFIGQKNNNAGVLLIVKNYTGSYLKYIEFFISLS